MSEPVVTGTEWIRNSLTELPEIIPIQPFVFSSDRFLLIYFIRYFEFPERRQGNVYKARRTRFPCTNRHAHTHIHIPSPSSASPTILSISDVHKRRRSRTTSPTIASMDSQGKCSGKQLAWVTLIQVEVTRQPAFTFTVNPPNISFKNELAPRGEARFVQLPTRCIIFFVFPFFFCQLYLYETADSKKKTVRTEYKCVLAILFLFIFIFISFVCGCGCRWVGCVLMRFWFIIEWTEGSGVVFYGGPLCEKSNVQILKLAKATPVRTCCRQRASRPLNGRPLVFLLFIYWLAVLVILMEMLSD